MNILYYSGLVSEKLLQEIINQSKGKNLPTQSVQKFHTLLTKGLEKHFIIKYISSIPFSNKLINLSNWDFKDDSNFIYTSINNRSSLLRQIQNFIISFIKSIIIIQKHGRNSYVAIFDYLNFSVSLGGYLACKLCGVNTIAIVTDLPDLMIRSKVFSFLNKLKYKWVNSFDGYILLSEYMNEVVNIKKRPFLIMEGVVDGNYNVNKITNKEKIILYAGGLYEKYGINKLVDAFQEINLDYELHFYGEGDSVKYINEVSRRCSRIKYFGSVPNSHIVQKIPLCSLLINPRPSELLLSRYSFPSKNLEYMLSGTPLVTTKLPSIPADHYPYLYFFEDETVSGFKNSLINLLKKNPDELNEKGLEAQAYVLNFKSNETQGNRISIFIKKNFIND